MVGVSMEWRPFLISLLSLIKKLMPFIPYKINQSETVRMEDGMIQNLDAPSIQWGRMIQNFTYIYMMVKTMVLLVALDTTFIFNALKYNFFKTLSYGFLVIILWHLGLNIAMGIITLFTILHRYLGRRYNVDDYLIHLKAYYTACFFSVILAIVGIIILPNEVRQNAILKEEENMETHAKREAMRDIFYIVEIRFIGTLIGGVLELAFLLFLVGLTLFTWLQFRYRWRSLREVF